jgi:hypothetical protein
MPLIGKGNLFVFGSRVLSQKIGCFEIDRAVVKKHCPYPITG